MKKNYFWCFIITPIYEESVKQIINDANNRVFEKIREIGKREESKLSKILQPKANYFKNKHNVKCVALIYGYQREISSNFIEKGKLIHNNVTRELLLNYGAMKNRVNSGFGLYAFGFGEQILFSDNEVDEFDYRWNLMELQIEVDSEAIYKIYPKKYLSYDFNKQEEEKSIFTPEMKCVYCGHVVGLMNEKMGGKSCPNCGRFVLQVSISKEDISNMLRGSSEKKES